MSYKVRAVKVVVGDQSYMGLEIPIEAVEQLDLQDGEILEATVTQDSLSIKRTGVIVHDDRSD